MPNHALLNKKRILFVYAAAADIYNEFGNRWTDNYSELCKITNFIKNKYGYDNFHILAVHTNKSYNNGNNILNYTINVPDHFLSNNMETHNDYTCNEYQRVLESIFRTIFRV
jgi:hypothetical protein